MTRIRAGQAGCCRSQERAAQAVDQKIESASRQPSASITGMDAETAARRWAETWSHAWPQRDVEAIATLYADTAVHYSAPFRPPGLGRAGVRRYLAGNFLAEADIECWFGPAVVSDGRAAVEWWASWTEQGQELTYAGVSVLGFDDQGQVVEHRDYDHHIERRQRPYAGW